MKAEPALKKLRCPSCIGELSARTFAEGPGGGTESGALLCDACRTLYPVEAGVPVMLRFQTSFHGWFQRAHAAEPQVVALHGGVADLDERAVLRIRPAGGRRRLPHA